MTRFSQANVSNTLKGFAVVSGLALSLTTSMSTFAATAPLSVTSQPSSVAIYEGKPLNFNIAATSGSAITYTWYKNGTKIGTNSATYSINSLSTGNAGTYSCTVTSGTSTYTCNSFTLTVNKLARITTQPTSLLVNEGTSQKLKITASGASPMSFQWYKNGAPISGATSTGIYFNSISAANAGSYYCVVKNAGSTATTSTASVKIISTPQSYSLNLNWSKPTVRADGKPLLASEISGYNLYYGTTSTGTMSRIASVSASELSYLATNLSAGTHYFAASTIDTNGLESALSPRIVKSVQ